VYVRSEAGRPCQQDLRSARAGRRVHVHAREHAGSCSMMADIHVHLGVPCRPGTGTPGHGTVPPCPGTARRDLVPCRASTPCRLSCPGTARLSLDGPCRAWGTVSPAVPCRARAQDTQELNQLQIMQYKQISYVQTQAFNNS